MPIFKNNLITSQRAVSVRFSDNDMIISEIALSLEKVYCSIAKDVMLKIRNGARHQGGSTETFINLWLQEKLAYTA